MLPHRWTCLRRTRWARPRSWARRFPPILPPPTAAGELRFKTIATWNGPDQLRRSARSLHNGAVLRYSVLASDYDGTLALDGRVADATLDALRRFKEAEGTFLLLTGRDLDDLRSVFPELTMCDLIVAENGALLYDPATGEERLLGPRPPERFLEALRMGGVTPLLPGRVIVSTRQPHEDTVLAVADDLGLSYHIIFNKGAVMILPPGINKGTGLQAALERLNVSPESVVAVGDAENDHSLLAGVGLGVAVSNALPSLCDEADFVLDSPATAGVAELIEMMLAGDARLVRRRPTAGAPVSEAVAAAVESVPGGS